MSTLKGQRTLIQLSEEAPTSFKIKGVSELHSVPAGLELQDPEYTSPQHQLRTAPKLASEDCQLTWKQRTPQ